MQHFLMIKASEAFRAGETHRAVLLYARVARSTVNPLRARAARKMLDIIAR